MKYQEAPIHTAAEVMGPLMGPLRNPAAKERAKIAAIKRAARREYLQSFTPVWRRPPGYEPPFHKKSAEWLANRKKCLADRENRRNRVSGPRDKGKFCVDPEIQWTSAPMI